MSSATLTVLSPGLSTLVVDGGRPRTRGLGVPVGGAADPFAFALGNLAGPLLLGHLFDTVGRVIIDFYGAGDGFASLTQSFNDNGPLMVLIGALSPIPLDSMAHAQLYPMDRGFGMATGNMGARVARTRTLRPNGG